MPRYIDAKQFFGKHKLAEIGGVLQYVIPYSDIVNAPTIDAAEVVRCRDCAARDTVSCPLYLWLGGKVVSDVCDDDYCSYGKRKEIKCDD